MMNRRRLIPFICIGLVGALAGACDKLPGATPPAPAAPMIAVDKNAPTPSSIQATLLATVVADRPTALAAMPNGSVYLVQAPINDSQTNEVLLIDAAGGEAHSCGLSADAVMTALNISSTPATAASATSPSKTRVAGRFTAIAARADGKLAFCFAGVRETQPFFAMGTFDPASNGAIYLPVDQITLAAAGDRDIANDTSRQNLFTAGDDAWLWRAGEHEIRLVTVQKLGTEPQLGTRHIAVELVRDANTRDIERSGWEWSATPQRGSFLLTDTASRWIRRINDQGEISHVARFDVSLVTTLSAATQDAAGRVIVLACDRDGIAQSLLVQDAATFKQVPTSAFHVPSPLEATRLQIDRMVPVPNVANAFIAYDGTSGAVVRVQLK